MKYIFEAVMIFLFIIVAVVIFALPIIIAMALTNSGIVFILSIVVGFILMIAFVSWFADNV